MKPFIEEWEMLQELLLDICHLWSWTFSRDYQLQKTNCTAPNLFTKIMLEEKHMQALRASNPGDPPLILSNDMGLMFSAVFGEENVWFLGPVYTVEVNERDIEKLLIPYHLNATITAALTDNLKKVPMISSSNLFEKTLILHRLVTGELTVVSDLRYHVTERRNKTAAPVLQEVRHASHDTEKQLLDHVRQGNLDYRNALSRAAIASPGIRARTGDPIRQAQYSVVAFITLCARAAIEGGLPVDTAYTLSDTYCTAVDACKTISEITMLSHTMLEDYITRVHRCRVTSGISRSVRIACDYIELHPEEEITLALLAEQTGYTPYYLSRKFKQETGMTPAAYLLKIRLERAKSLLSTTKMSIQEISDQMRFCTRSYFSDSFSREYGMSPAAWREENLNL